MSSKIFRRIQRTFALFGLFLLFLPIVCTASTPPVQPSLLFEISNHSSGHNDSLVFSAAWKGYVSYNKPPEQIVVNVYFEPNGSQLGSFLIPRLDHTCPSGDTCLYRTTVRIDKFPSGSFILNAYDPLSGAMSRQVISIPSHSNEDFGFFNQGNHDQLFWLTAGVIGAFLLFVLALQVRD
jgi:hypothetical protein